MGEQKKKKIIFLRWLPIKQWKMIAFYLLLYDIIVANGSYFLALWIRYDCHFTWIEEVYLSCWARFTPIYTAICILVFWHLRIYKSIWRFASYSEFSRIFLSTLITTVLHTVGITLIFERMPMSYYCIGAGLQFILMLTVRFLYRFVCLERNKNSENASRVMLIGAGSAGQMILRDLHNMKEVRNRVECIIDDDPEKQGLYIDGVPIVGNRDDIIANVMKYRIEKIYLAIPSATAEQKRDILNICNEAGCELKILPGLYQFVTGEILASAMKDVAVEDLLGREPIKTRMDEVFDFVNDKTILVTGGGGSIGSELCRQIAEHAPRRLIILDVYENNAYEIQTELREKYPNLDLVVLIGSVRDSRRLHQIFGLYMPDVVYHAAAHKHVPLMEDSPCEAIKNNAIGTYKTAYAAMTHHCQRFVLISTDKAVNPTNVMGASKRICEMIIQSFDRKIKAGKADEIPRLYTHWDDDYGNHRHIENPCTEYVAVRFGNVLGSNGSVIPLFKRQIAEGGPVTVTHPDIIRYFMTIPEAASLVLLAGTYAKGGDIFVLDMGSPVKIDTLARNLIKMSGLRPDIDIKIQYVGLRPGEKLYEEKLMAEEGLTTTPNKLIHVGRPIPFDTDEFLSQLQPLMDAAYNEDENGDIRELIAKIVPTYHPAGRHGSEKKGKAYEAEIQQIKTAQVG